MTGRLGITWGLSSLHGWGVFGLNLVRTLLAHQDRGWPRPLLLNETPLGAVDPAFHDMLAPLIAEHERLISGSAHLAQVGLRDTVVLHSSGNGLTHNEVSARFRGERNVGFTFFEETDIPEPALAAVRTMDRMLTGSMWNRNVLIAKGVPEAVCVHQGVDSALLAPRAKAGRFDGRFVVFGGGKLEFRKGQDIALAAFREFHARHPDSLLVTVWQNPWPDSIATLAESPHLLTLPNDGPPQTAIPAWSVTEGVPEGAHIDLGAVSNTALPEILAEADAALFPNRCEGGTNLALMECMALGLPCVASLNTGHADIVDDTVAYPLTRQGAVVGRPGSREGWGESDVAEAVERLEEIYANRAEAVSRGQRARDRMAGMTWETQVGKLIEALPS